MDDNLIKLLNFHDVGETVEEHIDKERPCAAHIRQCNLSKEMRVMCSNDYDGRKVANVANTPNNYEEYKRLCALSVCLKNIYKIFHIISSKETSEKKFVTGVINMIMKYGIIAGGFILSNISKYLKIKSIRQIKTGIYKSYGQKREKSDIDVYMTREQFYKRLNCICCIT